MTKTVLWSYHWTSNAQCDVKPLFIFRYKENKYQFHAPRNVICKNSVMELFITYVAYRRQENVVNIVTVLQAGWFRVLFLAGTRDFSLLWNIQAGSGAHLALYSMGTEDSATGGRAASGMMLNHSPLYNAKIKTGWSYPLHPTVCLHSMSGGLSHISSVVFVSIVLRCSTAKIHKISTRWLLINPFKQQ